MFQSDTLFVVGAGASEEVGLPVGAELKSLIATKADIRFERLRHQKSGSFKITEALRHFVKNHESQDINPFLEAGWKIKDAMPVALSIDNYIDAHQGDENIKLCGKLAIVESILESEKNSNLYVKDSAYSTINFHKLEKNWYTSLFKILSEGVVRSNLESIFDKISFISFNYDRCIEHFFVNALQIYYQIPRNEAQELTSKLKVIHPYGTVGPLQWQAKDGIVFGADVSGQKLFELSSKIRTFTERVAEEATLAEIRKTVREARTIVFLGFSFQSLNMKLLDSQSKSNSRRVFATAFGISDSDCQAVSLDIQDMLHKTPELSRATIRNDLKCSALFDEYWRTLPRS